MVFSGGLWHGLIAIRGEPEVPFLPKFCGVVFVGAFFVNFESAHYETMPLTVLDHQA